MSRGAMRARYLNIISSHVHTYIRLVRNIMCVLASASINEASTCDALGWTHVHDYHFVGNLIFQMNTLNCFNKYTAIVSDCTVSKDKSSAVCE